MPNLIFIPAPETRLTRRAQSSERSPLPPEYFRSDPAGRFDSTRTQRDLRGETLIKPQEKPTRNEARVFQLKTFPREIFRIFPVSTAGKSRGLACRCANANWTVARVKREGLAPRSTTEVDPLGPRDTFVLFRTKRAARHVEPREGNLAGEECV